MKIIFICILLIIPIFMVFAQQNVYLRNDKGHLKKLKNKTILTFKTSDSTWVTGRIIAAADSSFTVSTYEKHKLPDTINVQIKTVSQVTNKLLNKPGLATTSYFFGTIGVIGIITSPFLLITDTPEDALGLLEASAVFIGVAGILYSPYLIKRKFNTINKWTLLIQ